MEIELRKLGLSEYEIKVYTTLLVEGTLKGGEISRISKVPNGRAYEVLHKLRERGFVQEIRTKPKLFKPVDPKIAISILVNNRYKELEKLKIRLPKILHELKKTSPKTQTEEKITLLQGRYILEPIIKQQLEEVKNYFKRMFTFEYTPYEIFRLEKVLMKKGIKFKIVGTLLNRETFKLMKKAVEYGYEVRYYPVEELRLSIIDGVQSMVNLINKNNPEQRTVILIESKELTKALEHYFDMIWKKAIPIIAKTKIDQLFRIHPR